MNDVSTPLTCLFDCFISTCFRSVLNLLFLHCDTNPLQPTSTHVNSDYIVLSPMAWVSVAYLFISKVIFLNVGFELRMTHMKQ